MGIRHQPLLERQRHSTTRWNKNRNATQQDQRSTATTSPTASRAGQITNYIEIRAAILDYYKVISAFSRSTSTVGTNYNGGWTLTTIGGKEETTKAKEKARATTKGAEAKASTGAKDTTRDLPKATKEATTKEDTTRAHEKATQDPNTMDQARATKAKETTAKQKEKEATTT